MMFISIIFLFTSFQHGFSQNVALSNIRNETKEKNYKQDNKVKLFLDYNEKPQTINDNPSSIDTKSTIKSSIANKASTTAMKSLQNKNTIVNFIKDTKMKNQKESNRNLSTTFKLLEMRRAGIEEPYGLKMEDDNIQDILKTWKRPERLQTPTKRENRNPMTHIPKKPLLPNAKELNERKESNIFEILLDNQGISKKILKTNLPLRVVSDPAATTKFVNNKKRFEKKTRPGTRAELKTEMRPELNPEKAFAQKTKIMFEKNSKTKGKRPKKVIGKKGKKKIQKRARDSDDPIASIKKDILRKSKSPRPLSARLMDMAPAKGARIAYKRLRNRLCHRSVMIPEGPKYDSKGLIYMPAFQKQNKRSYPQTDRPKVVLPRCCNCCRKSVLGCE